MQHLIWTKCQGDVWCKLSSVNLDHEHYNDRVGVYIIWHGGPNPAVVYVGQGMIKDRIAQHRENSEILKYGNLGLYVTWASVSEEHRDGVETYLADKWDPKVGKTHPKVAPIEVNFPWS